MPLTYFLAQVMGVFSLILGVSLFQKKGFADVVDGLAANRALLYTTGLCTLLPGLLVVLMHNIWNAGLLALVVTLFGWVALLKGTFLLFLSGGAIGGWIQVVKIKELYWLYAIVLLVLGAYLTYAGFMG